MGLDVPRVHLIVKILQYTKIVILKLQAILAHIKYLNIFYLYRSLIFIEKVSLVTNFNLYSFHNIDKMLAEIPRNPTFPQHMINKEIKRIQKDVQDDVIPVSAGIYSEYKLIERLQVIPKPDIVNYEDKIFFETVDAAKFPCKSIACPLCGQEYGNKKNLAIQCHFCGIWNCQNCICPRKRYHPRAKESNSQRFSICYKCDDKFLSLTLNHGFVESRALLEEVMKRVRKQKDEYQKQCDKRQNDSNYARDTIHKNKFKISSIKKEQIDCKKYINKLQMQREDETMRLRVRQKYMAILLKKKQHLKQKKQQNTQPQQMIPIQNAIASKPIRTLSQKNVYSQSIRIQSASPQQENSIKDTTYSRTQENLSSSPPIENHIQPVKQAKLNNFFNYDEWGRTESNEVQHLVECVEKQESQASTRKPSQIEVRVEHKPESITIQKMAQIFSKPAAPQQDDGYSSQDEKQSLDDEVIKFRKAALMKAAIQQSHKSRIQAMDEQFSQNDPKKCSCQIY